MLNCYLVTECGNVIAAYRTTWDSVAERAPLGCYVLLMQERARMWIGELGDMTHSPSFPERLDLSQFAA